MSSVSPIRLLTLLVVTVLLLLLLMVGVLLTDTLLNIRQNLQQAPGWVLFLVLLAFAIFSLLSGWIIVRLLRPKKIPPEKKTRKYPVDEKSVVEQLQHSKSLGIDTSEAEQELERLQQRREAGIIHIVLFGEISSGKSSLIKALLPNTEIEISVKGGTTQNLNEYCWTSPAGDQLILTDMPGLNEISGQQSLSQQEALRSHLVIYLCDGDLTRSQAEELVTLKQLNKPILLALNKSDRLSEDELEQLTQQLKNRSHELGYSDVVAISTGGIRSVIRVLTDGTEETVEKKFPAQLDSLKVAIQNVIDQDSSTLDKLRDSAVFSLISSQLDEAQSVQLEQQALELTRSYSKKAVVAAVAAITPGTDILIQGYLATQMVKELCALYQVPVRKVDVDLLLELIQQHVRTHITLLLAVAGNALKAFPGAGTLAGGVLHAIAYGFLFESLGKSLAQSLHSRGELHPLQVASQFEDSLGENIKASAGYYTRMALKEFSNRE